jgi:class 3 adenylate cyclase/tetratricopeptide (TPR) repeat protein
MEHLHGRDLTRLVRVLRAEGRRLPLPVAVSVVAELLRGLHYAHTRVDAQGKPLGLVHRDVSPHNVVVTFDGVAKLVDFGVARLMTTTESVAAGARRGPGGGKYAYMSPEQARGDDVDHRTDVYSAGIVLWELIVGHRLFQDDDPEEKLRRVVEAVIPDPRPSNPEVDDELWRVLCAALARERDDRYASAALFEEDLRAWLFRVGRPTGSAQIASVMRDAFPDEAAHPSAAIDIARVVADLDRLDRVDVIGSDATPHGTPTGTPLPGRLRVGEHERRPVTALVVDVDGFTDLSLRLDPEDLFSRQFRLLRALRRTVDRFGGVVHRAVDDQVVVLFGLPLAREDDTVRALECANALHRTARDLEKRGVHVHLAIGAHCGEVTGGEGRAGPRFVARGDTTRLARRLSARADHGEVLCSGAVAQATRGEFRFAPGPDLPERGGGRPAPSLRLGARRRGVRATSSGPWLRRGAELELVRDALVGLGGGKGSALVVAGAMGAGRSRFVRELKDLATRRGLPFYIGRCGPVGVDPPLEPIRDVVRSILGLPEGVTTDDDLTRLGPLGLEPAEVEALAALLGVRRRSAEVEAIGHAVIELIRALAVERPVVVAIEDVERLSAAEGELLRGLAAGTSDRPVLWLLTHREPLHDAYADLGAVIRLGTFDRTSQRRLLAALLDVEDVDDALVDLVDRTCEGNALYVEEMARFLSTSDRIAIDGGVARLRDGGGPTLPTTLTGLVTARVDALDPASKGALQLAATFGTDFTLALLGEAAGIDDVAPIVADLAAHGLVHRVEADRYAFTSDLVRDVVLHGILGVQRRDQHRLAAAAIEARHADDLGPWFSALAQHCAAGGRLLDAARYALRDGEALERAGHLDRARRAYKQGLDWLAKAPQDPATYDARIQGEALLSLRLGALLTLTGEVTQGERHLQIALDIASDAGVPWIEVRAHVALGRSHQERGRGRLASAHLKQAEALLRVEPDDALAVECLEAQASIAFDEGRNDDATRLWADALRRSAGDPGAAARCRLGLANRHLRAGDGPAARALLDEGLRDASAAGDRILLGRVLNNIGLVHHLAGEYDDAVRWFRRALEAREGVGYARGVIVNHHNIGDAHFANGDLARAHVAFARSRELAVEARWERGVALNDVYLGAIEAEHGDAAGADKALAARQASKRLGDVEVAVTGALLIGRWLQGQGRRDEARALLIEGLKDAETLSLGPQASQIRAMLESGSTTP